MKSFNTVNAILTILFSFGVVGLFWALRKEVSHNSVTYITVSTVAASLMIITTFIAALLY